MKIITKDVVIEAIGLLCKCETIDAVGKILDDFQIEKRDIVDDKKYPQLKFIISPEEIRKMEEQNILIDGSINSEAISDKDPLTKLLYALAWKNAGLHKLHNIVRGIKNGEESTNGVVFYHFGKYLTGASPIIDQHVLRCFQIIKTKSDSTLKEVNHTHSDLIAEYKNWLANNLNEKLKKQTDYLYHVDKVFFALGKSYRRHSL